MANDYVKKKLNSKDDNGYYAQNIMSNSQMLCQKPNGQCYECNEAIIIEIPQQTESGEDESVPFQSKHPNLANFTENIKQITVAVIFLLVAVVFNLSILAAIHERVPMSQPPLPDVSFALLPKHDRALDISEYIIMFMTTFTILLTVVHRYRSILLRRICIIVGVLYFIRGICMGITQVPVANPQYYCSAQLNTTQSFEWWSFSKTIISRVGYMSLGMGLSVNGRHSFCGDYIFSGHTVILVFSYLFIDEYLFSTKKCWAWRLVKYLCLLLITVGIVCILIARGHYMIDIVIAYLITSRTFYIYHSICTNHNHNTLPKNYWTNIVWYPLYIYVESDVIEKRMLVENEYELVPFTNIAKIS